MTRSYWLQWCFFSLLVGGVVMAQQGPAKVVAELPGTALRWIHAAEPVFAEQNLKVENYTVGVMEKGDTVTVSLSSNPTPGARGSTGKFPGYWVTFSKKTGKILNQAYTR
jgi:hypothetical protein